MALLYFPFRVLSRVSSASKEAVGVELIKARGPTSRGHVLLGEWCGRVGMSFWASGVVESMEFA